MEEIFRKDGYEVITGLIERTRREGRHTAVLHGEYEIGQTVLLPSDFTLILEDCHLRQADGTFCHMFRNAGWRENGLNTLADADREIRLIGRGRAILDGGNYNGLSEFTSGKDGFPHVFQNCMLTFLNVRNFTVEGLQIRNQRWWATAFSHCHHGLIRDLDFLSDFSRIENGKRVFGLLSREETDREKYRDICVKNSDGVHLIEGCDDVLIENITGYTEDDTVALTALDGWDALHFHVEGDHEDLHDVIVRNVRSGAFCSNVRLLNQGGPKLYNILIDGVMDVSLGCPYFKRGGYGVRLGDDWMYGSRHSRADETFNIVIRNVWSRSRACVCARGERTDVRFENLFPFDGCPVALDEK